MKRLLQGLPLKLDKSSSLLPLPSKKIIALSLRLQRSLPLWNKKGVKEFPVVGTFLVAIIKHLMRSNLQDDSVFWLKIQADAVNHGSRNEMVSHSINSVRKEESGTGSGYKISRPYLVY